MNIWRVPYPKFGVGPGLERTAAVAARLGIDLTTFGAHGAVIVGSNGKGSTAAMCAALLQQADPSTGLFTSPHLFALNERFRIGGEDISDDELGRHWTHVTAAIDASGCADQIGGFEFLFLIAADWFKARGCTHTVWEAGLGGRLDPVRLIEAGQLALTSLDLEHTALLGDTLEAIAQEKIAAAQRGSTLFVIERKEARSAIEAYATENGVNLQFVAPLSGAPLAGAHQRSNAALALALAKHVTSMSPAQVEAGFASTRWPGRLEKLSDEPLVVIDVGHTPDGVAASVDGFNAMRGARAAVLVCGVSQDKDAAAIISRLSPSFSTIICVAAQHKGAPAAIVAAHAQSANPDAEIVLADTVVEARQLAIAKAGGGAIYVAGGLFLAAELKAVHLGRDPASLVFI